MPEIPDVMQVVVIETPNADVPVLEEALAALDLTPSSYSCLETGRASTFLVADNAEEAKDLAARLEVFFQDWLEMLAGKPAISTTEMRKEDWSQSWKKNFHSFRASERLVVKPSWEEYTAAPGDIVIPIDPGMCFGTGYHGTTKACLRFLDKIQREHGKLSFIDAGTGSGILSIGASLLGYGPIEAFDNDPQCITTALENMATAGIHDIQPVTAALGDFIPQQRAEVVAANILAVVLEAFAPDVIKLVRPEGFLILSGILTEQYPHLKETFTELGCVELERTTIDEWTSGLYRTPSEH